MAFPGDYTKYQEVTVDNTKVSATLTDFPVLIDLSNLVKTGNDLFDTCSSDGGDIRVTLSDGTTQLAREIVSIDTTGKTGEMWVKVPSLSSATDTVIRVWYNGTDTEPTSDSTFGPQNVWDSNYVAVYHMNQDPSGSAPQILDSTSNGYHCTSYGSMTSGDLVADYVGDGIDFDGSDDYVQASSELLSSLPCTLEFIGSAAPNGTWQGLLGTAYNSSWGYYRGVSLSINTDNKLAVSYGDGTGYDSSDRRTKYGTTTVPTGQCSLIATVSGATDMVLYINGSDDGGSYSGTGGSLDNGAGNGGIIGKSTFTVDAPCGDCIASEVRFSSMARSTDWVATQEENISAPSSFYSVGDETTGIPTGIVLTTSAATEVNSRSAILQGSLTDLDGEASVTVYFEFGATTSYGSTTDELVMTAPGNFSSRVTTFSEETEYHFRAVAKVGEDVTNGSDATLTTFECPINLRATEAITSILWEWDDMGTAYLDDIDFSTWLQNPGAEERTYTGGVYRPDYWPVDTGSLLESYPEGSTLAYEGSYFFAGSSSTPDVSTGKQELDLVSNGISATDIDAETLYFRFWGKQASHDGKDKGKLMIRFKDSSRNTIGSDVESDLVAVSPGHTWVDVSVCSLIPENTRYVDVIIYCYRVYGTNNNAYFDALQVSVTLEACV